MRLTVMIAVVALHWLSAPLVSDDMSAWLVPWFDHIVKTGIISAFAEPFGNYTPPYLYLLAVSTMLHGILPAVTIIKLLSIMGTGFLAWAMLRLLRAVQTRHAIDFSLLMFAIPTVAINAALLGQCDAIWAGACIAAVAALVERRMATAMVWCGVAFAFKAQAIFIAPVALGVMLARRPRWWVWLVAPAAFVSAMIPAMAVGWPAADIAFIYYGQAQTFKELSVNAPNIWVLVEQFGLANGQTGRLYAFMLSAIVGSAIVKAAFQTKANDHRRQVAVALLAALAMPYCLPLMHERYFFLADILAIALFAVHRNTVSLAVAFACQAGSLLGLMAYATGDVQWAMLGVAPISVAITLTMSLAFGTRSTTQKMLSSDNDGAVRNDDAVRDGR